MRPFAILIALLAAGPASAEVRKVMILPVQGDAAENERRDALAQMRAAFTGIDGFELVPVYQTLSELSAAEEMGLKCTPDNSECLARLALMVPADRMVCPRLNIVDGRLALRLDVYDASTAGLLQRVERTLPPIGPGRTSVLKEAALFLLVPERFLGGLVVTLIPPFDAAALDGGPPQKGSEIRFDSVPAGLHLISATASEQEISEEVEIKAGEILRMTLGSTQAPVASTPATEPGEAEPASALPTALLTSGTIVAGAGALLAVCGVGTGTFVLLDLVQLNMLTQSTDNGQRQLLAGGSVAAVGVGAVGTIGLIVGLALIGAGSVL